MRYLVYLCIICSFKQVAIGQSQGVTNSQTKLRPNQLRWSPTDATLDSVYIIRADTSTGEPGWYLVTLGGGGNADTTLAGDVVGGLNSTFVRKINGVTVENKTPQGREVLQYDGTQWTPDSIDLADLPQMNASRVLGRGSSSAGAVTQLTPSNGVKISGNYIESDLTAGTGINISGTTTLTVSNSAPDQTVTISGATGTYPNFTVTPTAPGGSSGQVQYNNAGSFGALDSFTVVANPDRLGVGVPVPTARVDIQGSGSTSATNALRVRNSSGTSLTTISNTGVPTFKIAPIASAQLVGFFGNNVSGGGKAYINISGNTDDDAGSATWSLYQNASEFEILYGNSRTSLGSFNGLKFDYFGRGIFRNSLSVGSTSYPSAGLQVSNSTTASTPSVLISGTGYSGGTATTTKPTLLIEPIGTTSTGWSTSGTKLGVNAESGFTGNLLDLKVNGSSFMSVLGSGTIIRNNASAYRNNTVNGSFYFDAGTIVIRDGDAGDTNVKLSFGSLTGTGHPMLKRNGAGIDIRLADDSGYGAGQSLYDRFGSGSPESVVTAPVGAVYHRTDGGAGTSFYVKESGTGNTGWIAK